MQATYYPVVSSRIAIALLTLALSANTVVAQIDQQQERAADGTAYQIITTMLTGTGAEELRITTIGGGVSGIGGCNVSQGMSGGLAQAIAGALPPGQTLYPYSQIVRTAILNPNDSTFNFDSSFSGRVTLGSGVSALNICANSFDCTGHTNVQSLVGLDSSTGGVPPACIANGASAGVKCDGGNLRNVFAFGIPASGNPPTCTNPAQVTTDTTICAPAPSDGVTLLSNQVLVVIYEGAPPQSEFACGNALSVGAAGFGIDTDGMNVPLCMANSVVSAQAALQSLPAVPCATNTPTETPIFSPTPTATPTRTVTLTATGTATRTATITPTGTATATRTRTGTATRTASSTPTATFTATLTPTMTDTPTRTGTATTTLTRTATYTGTATRTTTPSRTATVSPIATNTATATSTKTPPPTALPSRTATGTPTGTNAATATPTRTSSPTPTSSATHTTTPADTASSTVTQTATPTSTRTATNTGTATQTPEAAFVSIDLVADRSGDNEDGTFTTVVLALVSDAHGNPVGEGVSIGFALAPPEAGVTITQSGLTGELPSCDISTYVSATGQPLTPQPGTALACVRYVRSLAAQSITVSAEVTGAGGLVQAQRLIRLPAGPTPTPAPTGIPTRTATATPTLTGTSPATPSATNTPPASATATATLTNTPTATSMPTHTATALASTTPTRTATATAIATHTPARTDTVTPSPTATATNTLTPTCAATGTPYCSDECPVPPTLAPGCAFAGGGPCRQNPRCASDEICVPAGQFLCCSCVTLTPTATPVFTGSPIPSATATRSPAATPSATATTTVSPSATGTAISLPTRTATESASATTTVTQGPATQTPTTTSACAGDCGGNKQVTISDLVLCVDIALGSAQLSSCPAIDTDANGQVSISELIQAVNAALNGCAGV